MAGLAYSQLLGANFAISVSGTAAAQPPGFASPLQNGIGSINAGGAFQLGVGAGQANVLVSYVLLPQIPASGTTTLTLSTALTDILNQTGVTIARIKAFLLMLLSQTQNPTYGSVASSISCGASGVNPWVGVLNSTGVYNINNGAAWAHVDPSAAGMLVLPGSSDELLIKNNDAVNAAGVMLTLFGCSS